MSTKLSTTEALLSFPPPQRRALNDRRLTVRQKSLLAVAVGLFLFLGPGLARAANTHHYVCGDLNTGDGATCTSDAWSNGSPYSMADNTGILKLTIGTWYITATVSGASGTAFDIACYEYDSRCGSTVNISNGNTVDQALVISSSNSNYGIYFHGHGGSAGATLSNVCVSDTIGACAGGGGGGGGGGSTGGGSGIATPVITLASQPDTTYFSASDTGFTKVGNHMVANLGTGLSGRVDTILMHLTDSGGSAQAIEASIWCYTDSSYSQRCASGTNGMHYDSIISNGSTEVGWMSNQCVSTRTVDYPAYGITTDSGGDCTKGSPVVLDVSKYYKLVITSAANVYGNFSGGTFFYALQSGGTLIPPTTQTRIIATTPAPDSTVSTSTHFIFGATGYVNENDFATGTTQVYLRYRQLTGMGLCGNSNVAQSGEIGMNIAQAGSFLVSTAQPVLATGEYDAYMSIQKPQISLFGANFFNTDLAAPIEFKFTVSTSTVIEKDRVLLLLQTSGVGSGVQASTTSSLSTTTAMCVVSTNFDFVNCITFLFTPDPASIAQMGNQVNQVLQKVPWGYATRAAALLSQQATSTGTSTISSQLPSLVVDLKGTGLPMTQGVVSVDLTPYDKLLGTTSILGTATSTATGKTFRQIVEPGWDFLVILLFGVSAFFSLIGINVVGGVENLERNSRRVPRN